MIIHVSDLSKITEELIAHLRNVSGEEIDLSVDYYWNIETEQKYNPYENPTEIDLGQISDDWQELQQIIEKEREPIAYDLVKLAAILRAIGEHELG